MRRLEGTHEGIAFQVELSLGRSHLEWLVANHHDLQAVMSVASADPDAEIAVWGQAHGRGAYR